MSKTGFTQTTTGIVTLGNASPVTVTLTTRGPDIVPTSGSLAFGNVTGVEINTRASSSSLTLAGIETGITASISTGWLDVYSGGTRIYSGNNLPVSLGNSIRATIKSSSQYGETITGTITLGAGVGTFAVSTLPDTIAPELSFLDDVSST